MPANLTEQSTRDRVREACEDAGHIVPCRTLARDLGIPRSTANDHVRALYGADPMGMLQRQAAGPRSLPTTKEA